LNLKNLLSTALNSYHNGKTIPVETSLSTNASSFDSELGSKISSKVPLSDRLLMCKCSILRRHALISARKGQLAIAQQAINESHEIMMSSSLSVQARLISESFIESVTAYLDYVKGEFQSVKDRINKAMSIDAYLEKEFGYDVLALHRVQLVHNIMRLEKRCGNHQIVFNYGSKLLNYLEGESSSWPIPRFESGSLVHVNPELISRMFVQILSELSLCLINADSDVLQLFPLIASHIEGNTNLSCNIFPRPHEWIRVKQSYINNDLFLFLSRASEFLRGGPRELPLLWYSVVIDLYETCSKIDNPKAQKIQNEIAKDMQGVSHLPYEIKSHLSI
jgi:hypothetical protein